MRKTLLGKTKRQKKVESALNKEVDSFKASIDRASPNEPNLTLQISKDELRQYAARELGDWSDLTGTEITQTGDTETGDLIKKEDLVEGYLQRINNIQPEVPDFQSFLRNEPLPRITQKKGESNGDFQKRKEELKQNSAIKKWKSQYKQNLNDTKNRLKEQLSIVLDKEEYLNFINSVVTQLNKQLKEQVVDVEHETFKTLEKVKTWRLIFNRVEKALGPSPFVGFTQIATDFAKLGRLFNYPSSEQESGNFTTSLTSNLPTAQEAPDWLTETLPQIAAVNDMFFSVLQGLDRLNNLVEKTEALIETKQLKENSSTWDKFRLYGKIGLETLPLIKAGTTFWKSLSSYADIQTDSNQDFHKKYAELFDGVVLGGMGASGLLISVNNRYQLHKLGVNDDYPTQGKKQNQNQWKFETFYRQVLSDLKGRANRRILESTFMTLMSTTSIVTFTKEEDMKNSEFTPEQAMTELSLLGGYAALVMTMHKKSISETIMKTQSDLHTEMAKNLVGAYTASLQVEYPEDNSSITSEKEFYQSQGWPTTKEERDRLHSLIEIIVGKDRKNLFEEQRNDKYSKIHPEGITTMQEAINSGISMK